MPGFVNFESYGVGPWGGFAHVYDPAKPPVTVTLDQITPDEGIAVGGSVRGLVIRGNQIRNCSTPILFYGKNVPVPFSVLDVSVIDNDLFDWKIAGVRFKDYEYALTGQPTSYWPQRVSILNNRADGDPYHWNKVGTVRNTVATWKDTPVGAFVDVTKIGFALVAGNHVRNVPQLVAGFDGALHTVQDNVGYCKPADVGIAPPGYSPDNVGIGNLMAPQLGWRYVIEEGDPAQPTYGRVLNTCPLAVALTGAQTVPPTPAGGKWVAGTYVANLTLPTPGTNPLSFVSGWTRLTTGADASPGPNWLAVQTTASAL